jgi:hypothetical protein|tara:strand:- start:36803 stop:36949 length:147 start_codon:yes stop_codon:yes gene_type:complete
MDKENLNYYTQREWDRVVGIGKVPKEYQRPKPEELKSLQQPRSDETSK